MRIAIFSDNFYPELSGISDSIIRSAGELVRRGHTIAFHAPRYSKHDYEKVDRSFEELGLHGTHIYRFMSFPYPTGTGQGRLVVPTGIQTFFSLRKFRPDIIHVHLPFGVGLEGVLASRIFHVPLVGTNHTPMGEFVQYSPIRGAWIERATRRYTAWFYNRCSFVSAPCNAVLKDMERSGFRAPHRAISNPLDTQIFRPLKNHKELKGKYHLEGFTLLYAGRLAPEKNIGLILRAAQKLIPTIPTLTVAIMGSGTDEPALRRLAANLRLEDRVRFLGFVKSQEEMTEIYNASDLFIMPSTAETQSLVMMQAMLCGIPVIGVNAWGLPEYIPKEAGVVIEPHDERALRETVIALYEDTKRYQTLKKSAAAFAGKFSTTRIVDEWETVYAKAIQSQRNGA